MIDARERRQRQPRRPIAYLVIVIASAVVALGSAWEVKQSLAAPPAAASR